MVRLILQQHPSLVNAVFRNDPLLVNLVKLNAPHPHDGLRPPWALRVPADPALVRQCFTLLLAQPALDVFYVHEGEWMDVFVARCGFPDLACMLAEEVGGFRM